MSVILTPATDICAGLDHPSSGNLQQTVMIHNIEDHTKPVTSGYINRFTVKRNECHIRSSITRKGHGVPHLCHTHTYLRQTAKFFRRKKWFHALQVPVGCIQIIKQPQPAVKFSQFTCPAFDPERGGDISVGSLDSRQLGAILAPVALSEIGPTTGEV